MINQSQTLVSFPDCLSTEGIVKPGNVLGMSTALYGSQITTTLKPLGHTDMMTGTEHENPVCRCADSSLMLNLLAIPF